MASLHPVSFSTNPGSDATREDDIRTFPVIRSNTKGWVKAIVLFNLVKENYHVYQGIIPSLTAIAAAGQRTLAVLLVLIFLPLTASAASILCEYIGGGYICETMTIGEPDISSQTWSSSGGITLSTHTGPIVGANCMHGAQNGTVTTTITYFDSTMETMCKGYPVCNRPVAVTVLVSMNLLIAHLRHLHRVVMSHLSLKVVVSLNNSHSCQPAGAM